MEIASVCLDLVHTVRIIVSRMNSCFQENWFLPPSLWYINLVFGISVAFAHWKLCTPPIETISSIILFKKLGNQHRAQLMAYRSIQCAIHIILLMKCTWGGWTEIPGTASTPSRNLGYISMQPLVSGQMHVEYLSVSSSEFWPGDNEISRFGMQGRYAISAHSYQSPTKDFQIIFAAVLSSVNPTVTVTLKHATSSFSNAVPPQHPASRLRITSNIPWLCTCPHEQHHQHRFHVRTLNLPHSLIFRFSLPKSIFSPGHFSPSVRTSQPPILKASEIY